MQLTGWGNQGDNGRCVMGRAWSRGHTNLNRPTVYSLYCDQANKSILHAVSLLAGTRLFCGKSVNIKSRLTLCSE